MCGTFYFNKCMIPRAPHLIITNVNKTVNQINSASSFLKLSLLVYAFRLRAIETCSVQFGALHPLKDSHYLSYTEYELFHKSHLTLKLTVLEKKHTLLY